MKNPKDVMEVAEITDQLKLNWRGLNGGLSISEAKGRGKFHYRRERELLQH